MSEQAEIKDPVCGKAVDPLRARAVGIFGGVTHYFCSPECKARYGDPRRAPPAGAPDGVDRRESTDGAKQEPGREATGEWFNKSTREPSHSVRVERFADLESGAVPRVELPPTPSLLIEVAATRRRLRPWILIALVLLGGAAALVLGLHR